MARQLRKADFDHVPRRKCYEVRRNEYCPVRSLVVTERKAQPEVTNDA